jgi:uncharacterized OB-fold protein
MSDVSPQIDPLSADFWAGIEDGELRIVHCENCGRDSFPAIGSCPHCGSERTVSTAASGHGTVYSWVTIHIALDPAFADDVPYSVVVVDLEEGGRAIGRLIGTEAPTPGARVVFEIFRRGEVALPAFSVLPC